MFDAMTFLLTAIPSLPNVHRHVHADERGYWVLDEFTGSQIHSCPRQRRTILSMPISSNPRLEAGQL
jgi:hypothetical protein